MQHVFPHQSQNLYQPDWQHHPHHQYAQTQAAAAANAAAQQQHYGRLQQQQQQQNGGNVNGGNQNGGMGGMAGGSMGGMAGNGNGNMGGMGGDHGSGSMLVGEDRQVSEENRKVLDWIAQVLSASTREAALLELSKKREQVPELALILWHSFGMYTAPPGRGWDGRRG